MIEEIPVDGVSVLVCPKAHPIRHTFCKIALANGVDFKTLSSMLGHYSVAFTLDVYGHVTDDMKRDAAEKVSGVLKGAV